ncbi:probable inactive purple acid phosphatase 16 [Folsomia candida]|uniref:probable inactive purple acid phosphatase 16 n=1 Tax=Folsomia candida TaxID=158441 RepID=UPI000B8F88D2|nr:probable inactive purple acid phosphatase 16 [Folsomia candida]
MQNLPIYAFGLCAVLITASGIQLPRDPVHFNDDGTFKIVTFTDLHYGEGPGTEQGPANDLKSTKVMTDILRWEHPDFVVYTGDLMSAEVMFPNGSVYVDMLLKPVVDGGYRWASTYGNHDIGNNVTREEILETEQKYNLSYTQHGVDGVEGTTNYFVPIYPPKNVSNPSEAPSLILWFFDTRGGRNSSGGIPAYVHETAVEWFVQELASMNATWGPIPALAFFHYPTAEYSPIHDEIDQRPECPGQHDDIVTPQERDTGFMQALVNSGTVKSAFVGHNHGNGWCCYYQSVDLCYNRQSGHGGGWVGWTRGSRVITLNHATLWGQTNSYIRLENGTFTDFFPVRNFTQLN